MRDPEAFMWSPGGPVPRHALSPSVEMKPSKDVPRPLQGASSRVGGNKQA